MDLSLFKKPKFWMWVITLAVTVLILSFGIASYNKSHKTSFSDYLAPYYSDNNYYNGNMQ